MKAVAYCRYSTDNQTESSIMYQLDKIEEYCKKKNIELIDVYSDEAKTGKNTNREGFKKLMADSALKIFDAVIIYDQSRLSRNVVDWFSLRETLQNNGIVIHSVTSTIGGDIHTPAVFLNEGVTAIFGQMHVLQTREKTIDKLSSKAKKAEFCGGVPALGYDVVDGKYTINPKEAEIIKVIFRMYANGDSYNNIVDELNNRGYRTKTGGKFSTNSLYWILRNERYNGTFLFNKQQYKVLSVRNYVKENPPEKIIRIPNAIPAIIEMELWNIVQKRLKDKKNRAANKAKRTYLLTGLIECEKCGSAYYGFTSLNKGGRETSYYTCGRKQRKRDCNAKNINAAEIEPAVYYILKNMFLNKEILSEVADKMIEQYENTQDLTPQIKREIAQKENAIKNLLQAVENGLSSEVAFSRIAELQEEKKILNKRLFTECKHDITIDRESFIQKLTKDAEDFENDASKRKMIIKQYVYKVKIADDSIKILINNDFISAYSSTTGGATQI